MLLSTVQIDKVDATSDNPPSVMLDYSMFGNGVIKQTCFNQTTPVQKVYKNVLIKIKDIVNKSTIGIVFDDMIKPICSILFYLPQPYFDLNIINHVLFLPYLNIANINSHDKQLRVINPCMAFRTSFLNGRTINEWFECIQNKFIQQAQDNTIQVRQHNFKSWFQPIKLLSTFSDRDVILLLRITRLGQTKHTANGSKLIAAIGMDSWGSKIDIVMWTLAVDKFETVFRENKWFCVQSFRLKKRNQYCRCLDIPFYIEITSTTTIREKQGVTTIRNLPVVLLKTRRKIQTKTIIKPYVEYVNVKRKQSTITTFFKSHINGAMKNKMKTKKNKHTPKKIAVIRNHSILQYGKKRLNM